MVRLRDTGRSRGLTLIEISAVVVIVGILAILGVVGYRRVVDNGRFAEATGLVGNIRAAQTTYYAEIGYYADISLGVNKNFTYPTKNPGGRKVGWGAPCDLTVCKPNMSFSSINVSATGPVEFGYTTVANRPGCDPACKGVIITNGGTPVVWGPNAQNEDWFIVHALASFNPGSTDPSAHVVGSVWSKDLIVGQE